MPFFLEATSGTSGDATWSEHELADDVLTTQGDILYRDATGLARLPAGTAGQALLTGGVGANPSWGAAGSNALVQSDSDQHVCASTNEEAFGNPYTISANTLTVGSVIQARYLVNFDAGGGSKDNITLRVRLGGLGGSVVFGTADGFYSGSTLTVIDVTVVVTSIGALGVSVSTGYWYYQTPDGTRSDAAAAAYQVASDNAVATNTTGDLDLVLTIEGEIGSTMTNNAMVWQYAP